MSDEAAQIRFYEDKLRWEIDPSDLQALLEHGEKVVIVDARSEESYAREHIPGAVSLPHRRMEREGAAKLDRTALIVTYCEGVGCNASTKGALNLARLGFRVKELIGGLEWWRKDGFPTEKA